jgi:hypothetical protein
MGSRMLNDPLVQLSLRAVLLMLLLGLFLPVFLVAYIWAEAFVFDLDKVTTWPYTVISRIKDLPSLLTSLYSALPALIVGSCFRGVGEDQRLTWLGYFAYALVVVSLIFATILFLVIDPSSSDQIQNIGHAQTNDEGMAILETLRGSTKAVLDSSLVYFALFTGISLERRTGG